MSKSRRDPPAKAVEKAKVSYRTRWSCRKLIDFERADDRLVKKGLWINRTQRSAGQPIKRGRIKRLEKHFQRPIL